MKTQNWKQIYTDCMTTVLSHYNSSPTVTSNLENNLIQQNKKKKIISSTEYISLIYIYLYIYI